MKRYKVYVDGSYRNNTATWGFVVVDGNRSVDRDAGSVEKIDAATNGRQVVGELAAAMRAVLWAKRNNARIVIYYDYMGVEKWATGDWKAKKPVTRKYAEFMRKHQQNIVGFCKVRAHSGDRWNKVADNLAGSVAV